MDLVEGKEYAVIYPFFGDTYITFEAGGSHEEETWRPGCRSEPLPPDDCEWVADGEGKMILTLVSIHKPGKYPARVFYIRKFIDPDGREFGSSKLRMTTIPTFKKRATGYYYEYRLND